MIVVTLLSASSCKDRETWRKSTLVYFDTVCEINLFCSDRAFNSAQEEVRRVFSEIDSHFSPQARDYSSPLVRELFQKARAVYEDSQGSFDITVAPLSDLWGFQTKAFVLPSPDEIQSALANVGMDRISLRPEGLSLPPGMSLDWGGIAKGLGIDRAAQALIARGFDRGFINAGGDLYCWGLNPDREPWNIGIKHPRTEGYLGVLAISDLGAATSGDYQRFFIREGRRYHHIFDPKTGFPARGKQSVTVVGPETCMCDALSTALFVSPEPDAILSKYPDYGAVIVDAQGNIQQVGKTYAFQIWK